MEPRESYSAAHTQHPEIYVYMCISVLVPSANALTPRLQGSLQLEGVVREGLAFVARDAHAYSDEILEHGALEVRNHIVCVS